MLRADCTDNTLSRQTSSLGDSGNLAAYVAPKYLSASSLKSSLSFSVVPSVLEANCSSAITALS